MQGKSSLSRIEDEQKLVCRGEKEVVGFEIKEKRRKRRRRDSGG